MNTLFSIRSLLYTILLFSLSLFSCKKGSLEPKTIEKIASGSSSDLQKILFVNDTLGYIIGGMRFSEATILETYDGGVSWHKIVPSNVEFKKKLFGICQYENSVFAGGVDGKFLKNNINEPEIWSYHQTNVWHVFNGIEFASKNSGYIVYGSVFQTGGVLKIDTFGQILKTDTFTFEVSDVQFTSASTGFISGYGAIMKTEDEGGSWKYMDVSGDFFKSLTCLNAEDIWSVGYMGSIVNSNDGGESWKTQRNGNNPLLERWNLRDVKFKNKQIGYAVGDKGLIIKTENGGKSWNKLKSGLQQDFFGLTLFQNSLWVVGEEGIVLRVTE